MPYIVKEDRVKYEPHIQILVDFENIDYGTDTVSLATSELYTNIKTVGELNYVLSSILWRRFDKKPSYAVINKIVDVFEELKYRLMGIEYYRTALGDLLYPIVNCLKEYHNMEVLGVLECAKLEFYARKARPYESGAMSRNSDIE